MEIDFSDGNINEPMSEELQYKFYQKMKDVIWVLQLKRNRKTQCTATGFCIDPSGLLVTADHVLDESREGSVVYARRDKDEEFTECQVVFQAPHLDLALLQLCMSSSSNRQVGKKKGESSKSNKGQGSKSKSISDGNFTQFDFVKLDDNVSRNIPVGSELFYIGISRSQGFHFLRGVMACEFEGDNTDYDRLVEESESQFEFEPARLEDTPFYTCNKYGVSKGSMADDDKTHPELKYLQMDFSGMNDLNGDSGSPIFNSQGKVLGIMQHECGSISQAASASAMYALVKHYKDGLGLV